MAVKHKKKKRQIKENQMLRKKKLWLDVNF